jgi:Ca2+-binding RTX toxin-like protein
MAGNRIFAGPGQDYLVWDGGVVSIDLGAGTVDGGAGIDFIESIESAQTLGGNDTLIGDERANRLFGNDGNDHLEGRGGNDLVDAGVEPSDFADGGDGTDECYSGGTILNCELP